MAYLYHSLGHFYTAVCNLESEADPSGLGSHIGQQPADQLPQFHLVTLLIKVSVDTERERYATQVIRHGWSRSTLIP